MASDLLRQLDVLSIFAEAQDLTPREGSRYHESKGTCDEQLAPPSRKTKPFRKSIKTPTNFGQPPQGG